VRLSNPRPNGLLSPVGAQGGLSTYLGQNITFFAKDRKPSYAQRWSLGVQRQLPAGFVMEATYVGNRATHLPVGRNLNVLPAQYLSRTPFRDTATINYLGAQFPSPFYGLNPQYTSTTMSRSSLLMPYPQFGSVTYLDPVGYSWYHALQSQVEKRQGLHPPGLLHLVPRHGRHHVPQCAGPDALRIPLLDRPRHR
jgi:hypothetical protein